MCREDSGFELAVCIPDVSVWTNVGVRSCYEPVFLTFTEGDGVMSTYQALYRKYRPQTFDDVSGQLAITQTLKTQVMTDKLSHAYLFTGSRGTGKTSCAKILAKAVNCLNPDNGNPCNCCSACRAIDSGSCMDVLEIDAASNNGVDNIRDLRDDAVYTPSEVRKRVYIVDEVHMLSLSAFNALLKIIEEPPEHLLFILATTELHKVPATILSRCQRFAFRRISQEDIAARLQYVAYQENIDLDESAARVLARLADGGMRDGLSLLDQCASASGAELTAQRVYDCLGIAGEHQCGTLLGYIAAQNTVAALELFNSLYAHGKDVSALLDELACLIRDLMVMKTAPNTGIAMLSGVASDKEVLELVQALSTGELIRMMELIQQTVSGFNRSAGRRMDAEMCIIQMCRPELNEDIRAINARLSRVEDQIKGGNIVVSTSPQKQKAPVAAEEKEAEEVPEEERPMFAPSEVPANFWPDLAAEIRRELKPPASGYFVATPNCPLQGAVVGNRLELRCMDDFVALEVGRKENLEVAARKASAKLGRPVQAVVVRPYERSSAQPKLEQLLQFGKEHQDIINIKE